MAAGGGGSDGEETERREAEAHAELERLIGGQEMRIQNLQSSAFQLANYFFVFQGVVVAAISNTTSLVCSDAWFIFSLSLLAATLNLFALFSIAAKYVRVMDLHELTWADYSRTAGPVRRSGLNRFIAGDPPTPPAGAGEGSNSNHSNREWRDHFSRRRRYAVLAVCMVLFLAFTAVTLAGPWMITCRRDRRLRESRRSGGDCVRLCDENRRCMHFCREI